MLLVKVEEYLGGGIGLEVEGPWALRVYFNPRPDRDLSFAFCNSGCDPSANCSSFLFSPLLSRGDSPSGTKAQSKLFLPYVTFGDSVSPQEQITTNI